MLVSQTNNIFWEMIRKQKEQKALLREEELAAATRDKHGSIFIKKQFTLIGGNEDPKTLLEKLPTYSKISLLQALLKEMTSIKERFEDNRKDLLEKIGNNCNSIYKNKIGIKEIYDYCKSNSPEQHYNYVLVEDAEEALRDKYNIIYDAIFLIRNSNDIMVNFIQNCPKRSYEQFVDFLVHFFYENTIDSTLNEEELIIIIYLVIEDYFLKTLPDNFFLDNIDDKKNKIFLRESILYEIFKSITRKPELRNFTCTVLSEAILKLEGYNDIISVETKIIANKMINDLDNQDAHSGRSNSKRITDKINRFVLDKTSTISTSDYSKTFSSSGFLDNLLNNGEEYPSEIDEKINLDKIEINSAVFEEDITMAYLKQKLKEFEEKNKNKNDIASSMIDFIKMQISQIKLENCEIFSNSTKITNVKKYTAINGKENSDLLLDTLLKNYNKLTTFIDEVLIKLKENINSLPYIVKSLFKIIEILFDKKYAKKKPKDFNFQQLMILSNYLVGNIILPLISNPDFNGIITTCVISKITNDNLEVITKILNKLLSGHLFSNKTEPEYTIFNKYIIKTLPQVFDIIKSLNLKKNFQLSKVVQRLINTSDLIGKPTRNINYDYFKENQDNIQQQSICFSWLDLVILIDLFKFYSVSDKNNERIKKYAEQFKDFINLREFCAEKWKKNLANFQVDYFLLKRINYSPGFNKQIEHIIEDNYLALMSSKEKGDQNVLLIKKCLVEVLTYVNKIHKESFNYFVQNAYEQIIKDNDIFSLLLNEVIFDKYNDTRFDDKKNVSNKNVRKNTGRKEIIHLCGLEQNENEDADFKDVIFPQIIDAIKYELGHNLDSEKIKRIVFCSSYLQLHINDLPQKYKENNYSLLILEIIRKHESIINELNFSIINQFYLKLKGGEKLNMIISSNYLKIKEMEKCLCIEFLFDKLDLPCKLKTKKDNNGSIIEIIYETVESSQSYIHSIQSFINVFPDFRKYTNKVEDIIDFEEKVGIDVALNNYFKDLSKLVKKEKIISKFSKEELESITYELENYILFKLHEKLFPKEPTKVDQKFYKKCCRLDFVQPENLIKDKKMINEKLWETAMELIRDMDTKLTPADKVKNFGKAFDILQNSITFSSGKKDLGIDDTITTLIYVILKSKPRNIFSNSKYCQLFLNPELSKKQYGILMSQIEMIKKIIYDMKHTDLIGVTESQFGKDED
jgi:hypothetical protein